MDRGNSSCLIVDVYLKQIYIRSYNICKRDKVKSVMWKKCWSGKRPVRLTFHNPLLCFYGFPWTPSIPVWRVFWPIMRMRWQLEEQITAPASRQACCRQVFLLYSQLYFSAVLYFSPMVVFWSFVVSMDYRSPAIPAPTIPGADGRPASAWQGRWWVEWGDHCVWCTGGESRLQRSLFSLGESVSTPAN